MTATWRSSEGRPGLHVDTDAEHNYRNPTADYTCGECGTQNQSRGGPGVRALIYEYQGHKKAHEDQAAAQ